MDLTLEAYKTVENVLVMLEAASQMVAAVLFVRADTEHRNATAAETTSFFENTNFAQYPGPVAVRFDPEGCFGSREWTEAFARLDTLPDHTAGQAHHQLEDGQSKH